MDHTPGHPHHPALSPRLQVQGMCTPPCCTVPRRAPIPVLGRSDTPAHAPFRSWAAACRASPTAATVTAASECWGLGAGWGTWGRTGRGNRVPHLAAPQEAQRAEAEEWLPPQLHPLFGFITHDAHSPALLQVGPAPADPRPCPPCHWMPPLVLGMQWGLAEWGRLVWSCSIVRTGLGRGAGGRPTPGKALPLGVGPGAQKM